MVFQTFNALLTLNFVQSKVDYSLFDSFQGSSFITLLVYVDDAIVASNDEASISELKYILYQQFNLKTLNDLKPFLGLKVAHNYKGISLC